MRLVETDGGPVEVGHSPGRVSVDVEALMWLAHRGDYETRAHLTPEQAEAFAIALAASAHEARAKGLANVQGESVARALSFRTAVGG